MSISIAIIRPLCFKCGEEALYVPFCKHMRLHIKYSDNYDIQINV